MPDITMTDITAGQMVRGSNSVVRNMGVQLACLQCSPYNIGLLWCMPLAWQAVPVLENHSWCTVPSRIHSPWPQHAQQHAALAQPGLVELSSHASTSAISLQTRYLILRSLHGRIQTLVLTTQHLRSNEGCIYGGITADNCSQQQLRQAVPFHVLVLRTSCLFLTQKHRNVTSRLNHRSMAYRARKYPC